MVVMVVFFSCRRCGIFYLVNRRGNPLGVTGLEAYLSLCTCSGLILMAICKHTVYANKRLYFSNTFNISEIQSNVWAIPIPTFLTHAPYYNASDFKHHLY